MPGPQACHSLTKLVYSTHEASLQCIFVGQLYRVQVLSLDYFCLLPEEVFVVETGTHSLVVEQWVFCYCPQQRSEGIL